MTLVFLVLLILLNGIFAMAEIAMVTAKLPKLEARAKSGDIAAGIACRLIQNPTQFLSALQIGITSIGVLNGILGEASLAQPLSEQFIFWGISESASHYLATGIIVTSITYFTIVLGELVPKRMGQLYPEQISRFFAPLLQAISIIALPFIWMLSSATNAIVKLLGIKRAEKKRLSQEEIHAFLDEVSSSSQLPSPQRQMLHNVFHLDYRQLSSLMIPRPDTVLIDILQPVQDNLNRIVNSEHSTFPVCRGNLDNVLGVLKARQVLPSILKGEIPDFTANLAKPKFVPETISATELLDEFRTHHHHLVFVLDEYGDVQGIVTLHDIMQAITGELQTTEPCQDSCLFDASMSLPELRDKLQIAKFPDEEKHRYHTLAGLIIYLLNKIPSEGDSTTYMDWKFTVKSMKKRRIEKVLITSTLEQ